MLHFSTACRLLNLRHKINHGASWRLWQPASSLNLCRRSGSLQAGLNGSSRNVQGQLSAPQGTRTVNLHGHAPLSDGLMWASNTAGSRTLPPPPPPGSSMHLCGIQMHRSSLSLHTVLTAAQLHHGLLVHSPGQAQVSSPVLALTYAQRALDGAALLSLHKAGSLSPAQACTRFGRLLECLAAHCAHSS